MKINLCVFIAFIIHLSAYSQWVQTGGPTGGSTNEIVQVGSELIVSVGNGGIYKSFDNGNTWKLSISGLPCNPSINVLVEHNGLIYASVSANGIYVSTDKGNHWVPLNTGIENLTFSSVFVDGFDIYGGSSDGRVYYSSDGGSTWTNKSNGISNDPLFTNYITDFVKYNSKVYACGTFLFETSNNGTTWVKVAIPNLNSNGLSALIVHNNIFYGSSEGVIYASSDGFASWETQLINNNNATITGLFSFDNVLYCTTSLGRYYYSNDNGAHWIPVQNSTSQSNVHHLFFINNAILMSTSEGLYKSTDNGLTWTRNNEGINALQIESLARNNSYLFAGTTTSGIFRSADNGDHWTLINNGLNNLSSLQINGISTNGNFIVIATNDGIYYSANHGNSWVKRFDPGLNKSTQCLDYDNGVFVTAVNGMGVYKSVDNGVTWNLTATNGMDTDTSFYSIKINSNVIVVSTHGGDMYMSKDSGNTWQNISIKSSFHLTYAFEFKNNKLYAATTKGLMISADLGQNWNAFNNDPKSINDVLFDDDKIYITTDFGNYIATEHEKVWYALCDGMGNQFTNKLLIHNDIVFAGTWVTSVWKRSKVIGTLPPSENSATIGIEKLSLCATSSAVNLYSEIGISSSSKGSWTPTLSGANGIFDPLIDPAGIYTFTFDGGLCGCANYLRIEVSLDGQVNAGNDTSLILCKDDGTINLFDSLDGNPDLGGTWTPQLASGTAVFDPLLDAEGIYTYNVSNVQCGTASSKIDITLVNRPNSGTNAQVSICENDPAMDLLTILGGNADLGGVWWPNLSSGTNLFDPSIDSSGIYTYTVSNGNCQSVSEIDMSVIRETNAGMDGVLSICIENVAVNLIDYLKGNPDADGTWYPLLIDGNGIFNPSKDAEGIYTYTTTSNCNTDSSTVTVSIIAKTAVANYDIEVRDFSNSNAITITIDSGLAYEYSLDGRLYQNSTVFNNLKGGVYTVYGREINGCGYFEKEVFVIDYPRFFTPNNDGINDFWQIIGVSNEKYKVYIFDRYGKLLRVFETIRDKWDGTYNGYPMPTTDYWFKIVLDDLIVKTGHFTLKR